LHDYFGENGANISIYAPLFNGLAYAPFIGMKVGIMNICNMKYFIFFLALFNIFKKYPEAIYFF